MTTNQYTMNQLGSYLRIPTYTISRIARNEEIPAIKHKRRWRFDPKEINRWLMGNYARSEEIGDHAGDEILTLTIEEVCAIVNLDKDQVKRMVTQGEIPGRKIGKVRYRFPFWAIIWWVRNVHQPDGNRDNSHLWDIHTASAYLRIDTTTLKTLVAQNDIPSDWMLDKIVFSPVSLEWWLSGNASGHTRTFTNKQTDIESCMTLHEVAQTLDLQEATVREMALHGHIPARYIIGFGWRFSHRWLNDWMTSKGNSWRDRIIVQVAKASSRENGQSECKTKEGV